MKQYKELEMKQKKKDPNRKIWTGTQKTFHKNGNKNKKKSNK